MTKTRGPAVYGTLHVNANASKPYYKEVNVAWTWAKQMIRQRYPRCRFQLHTYSVVATKKGTVVGLFVFDHPGSEVTW